VRVALLALLPVLAAVIALARWLGPGFAVVAAVYLALNLAYTFYLKQQVLIDVFIIASGFVLRAIAGVELLLPVSPGTELSPWLLMCTFFGALFLALGKRGRELSNAGEDAHTARRARALHPELKTAC
jgi:4-hydroxybenzoate polyprenyltransferase